MYPGTSQKIHVILFNNMIVTNKISLNSILVILYRLSCCCSLGLFSMLHLILGYELRLCVLKDLLCDSSNIHAKTFSENQFKDLVTDTKSFTQLFVYSISLNLHEVYHLNLNCPWLSKIQAEETFCDLLCISFGVWIN